MELEAELRRAAELFDPVPPRLMRDAGAAYAMRTIDAELAELTFDSLTEAGMVRAADPARLLTFTASAIDIEVEIIWIDAAPGIVGRLIPARSASIDVRCLDRTISVTADALGRFTAGPLAPGPFSLRCRLEPDIVTEWVSTR
jgi:hypothetical protein